MVLGISNRGNEIQLFTEILGELEDQQKMLLEKLVTKNKNRFSIFLCAVKLMLM